VGPGGPSQRSIGPPDGTRGSEPRAPGSGHRRRRGGGGRGGNSAGGPRQGVDSARGGNRSEAYGGRPESGYGGRGPGGRGGGGGGRGGPGARPQGPGGAHPGRFGPRRGGDMRGARRNGGGRRAPLEALLKELQSHTSVDPHDRIVLETEPQGFTTRALDLLTPIGKGQRCLIVAPPKAGKTTLLKDVAHAVLRNHPEIEVVVLLVDERPEEVTDFRRAVLGADIFAASSDQIAEEHVVIADEALHRALGSVLEGRDVLLLLDSITRLARAYNVTQGSSGRTLTGGLDATTMQVPRQIFGAARKIEGGGSLTILGTALVQTGSRMDDVIFQEFKGTGNMELVLSRELFEKRIFPCIDIAKSGTRKEEKLYAPDVVGRAQRLRRALATLDPAQAMEYVLELLRRHPTNRELLNSLPMH
jgi:transcription termination factor Rho